MKKGCVYFFKHTGLSPVKIGFTRNKSPNKRFACLNTYSPYGCEIVGFIYTDNPKEVEQELHLKYIKNKLNNEWFEISITDVNNEIEFYNNRQFLIDKNNFSINWLESKIDIPTKKTRKEKYDEFLKLHNKDISIMTISETIGVSRQTIYNWIENLKQII